MLAQANLKNTLLRGLEKLEYRGYDAAGVAIIGERLSLRKVVGNIENLIVECATMPDDGLLGIGHTRWATHGSATLKNTHPIVKNGVIVAHNGIIENYLGLREELKHLSFETDTDSEIIPALISYYIELGYDKTAAIFEAVKKLTGNYSFVAAYEWDSSLLIGVQCGLSLAVGAGQIASDSNAMSEDVVTYLENNEIVFCTLEGYFIKKLTGEDVLRQPVTLQREEKPIRSCRSYMEQEILEQPKIISDLHDKYLASPNWSEFEALDLKKYNQIQIVACGSSYNAGMIAKHWFEQYAKIHTNVEISSEFYNKCLSKNTLYVCISQSGETADTIAALKHIKDLEPNAYILSILNRQNTQMERLSSCTIQTAAGQEVSVASTKAFIAQLMILFCLCTYLSGNKMLLQDSHVLLQLQKALQSIENLNSVIKTGFSRMLFIGRGTAYPLALEAALKMNEVNYITSLGVAAGELKHGNLALIDQSTLLIAIAPVGQNFNKMVSNIEEICTRGGQLLILTSEKGLKQMRLPNTTKVLLMPEIPESIFPFFYAIPLQMFACYMGYARGRDIDKPRNLAKSVTVE